MPNRSHAIIWKAVATLAAAVLVGACSSDTSDTRTITLTFVRHAQSVSNAEQVLDTAVPGPSLTPDGEKQAQEIATELGRDDIDGIYASAMARAQQTAAPLSKDLSEPVDVLPGLNEIDAGWFEGEPMDRAEDTYLVAPMDWLRGYHDFSIPGSVSGNEFNDEFGAAVQKIYDSGDSDPVAFSHGAAIMFWTQMNVKNPKHSLVTAHPLPNAGRVVISGSPETGWTLVDWDGIGQFN